MMAKLQKIVSVFLVMLLCLSMVPMSVWAADEGSGVEQGASTVAVDAGESVEDGNTAEDADHVYSAEYTYDENGHWRVCEDCAAVAEAEPHCGGNATCVEKALCEVCGQPYGETAEHIYQGGVFGDIDENGIAYHYIGCDVCGAEQPDTREGCVYTYWADTEVHWLACDVCGQEGSVPSEHIMGEWQNVDDPWGSSAERCCEVCGYVEYMEDYEPGDSAGTDNSDSTVCGDDLTWTLENGVLTISGTGDMYDYENYEWGGDWVAPWMAYAEEITEVVVESGVTSVGSCAFSSLPNLTRVTLAEGVETIGAWAFEFCRSLSEITIPVSMKTIRSGVFEGCRGLTTVNYNGDEESWNAMSIGSNNPYLWLASGYPPNGSCGENVTWKIENDVLTFSGEGAMPDEMETMSWTSFSYTAVVIGEGVTTISDYAWFSNLVTEVTIPSTMESIGMYVFSGCYNLTTVNYNGDEESWNAMTIRVGNGNLWKASGYDLSVGGTFDNGVAWALEGSVLTVTGEGGIPGNEGYEKRVLIEEELSSQCPWSDYGDLIETVIIGEGITAIGDWAFRDCYKMTSVKLPASLETIGSFAFSVAYNLKTVEYAGENWYSMTIGGGNSYLWDAAGYEVWVSGTSGDVKWELSGTTLTIFGEGSMADYDDESTAPWKNYTVNKVVITEGVTHIGSSSFEEFSISQLEIPEGVESIGSYAFAWCYNLSYVDFPDSLKTIGSNAFFESDLSCVIFGDGLTEIERSAFEYTNLFNVLYVGSEEDWAEIIIGDGNEWLTEVNIVFGYTRGEEIVLASGDCGADADHGSVAWILYSSGRMVISGEGAMFDYEGSWDVPWWSLNGVIRTLQVENGVTHVGQCAFMGCNNLTDVELADSVVSLGDEAFSYCDSLKSITFSKSLTTLGENAFFYCYELQSINLPNTVTEIAYAAFSGCESLTEVSIPERVVSIDGRAFYGCQDIEAVYIPENLTVIGADAFAGCFAIADVYYAGTASQWNDIVIEAGNEYLTDAVHLFDDDIFGDINDTGSVGADDLVTLMRYIVGDADTDVKGTTDLNKDGVTDILDVIYLIWYIVDIKTG